MQICKISVFIFGVIMSFITIMEVFDKIKFMKSKVIIR